MEETTTKIARFDIEDNSETIRDAQMLCASLGIDNRAWTRTARGPQLSMTCSQELIDQFQAQTFGC